MDENYSEGLALSVSGSISERDGRRGRLKVFLGMAPGVGKTDAMLRAALAAKLGGSDVVLASAVAHGVREVESLAGRLPSVGAQSASDFNVDEVLARKPALVVVDALARANTAAAGHPKRWQAVLELLEAGINVYTTLNVYEISSRADLLLTISGMPSHQTVPDNLLDNASIVPVDLPPSELIARRRNQPIRLSEEVGVQEHAWFEEGRLMQLREMAARFFAEHTAREAQLQRQSSNARGPGKGGHRLLVAIEANWDAEHIIFWTRRLAGSLNAPWIVLYVETSRGASSEEESRLTRNLELARELGAEVITTTGEDFVEAILRTAAPRNITQIVAAKKEPAPWWQPFPSDPVIARLIRGSGEIGVHVVPVTQGTRLRRPHRRMAGPGWRQYAVVVATVVLVALAGFLFTPRVEPHAMAFLSLLAVVILALFVDRGPALLAAALSAAIWDYFFLPPVFAFRVSHFEDALLLGMYFVVALALGQLTARIRAQEAAERQREGRATALYLLGRELAEASTLPQIVEKVVAEMRRCFDAESVVLLLDGADQLQEYSGSSLTLDEKGHAVAVWVLEHRQPAGKFTPNLSSAEVMFVPLESSHNMIGVMALRLPQTATHTIHQRNLLDALTRQIALALDRQRLSEISEKARLLAESERLGKTLLDSMSHEIRTPLAAIKAAVTDLAELQSSTAPGQTLISEIQEASERLNRLVGKVLDITRLESGHVTPLLNECEVADIIHTAIAETEKELAEHPLEVEIAPALPIFRTDFVFLQQALMNLLSNAAIHTPAGTSISLRVWRDAESLYLRVADRGAGIAAEFLPRVFDKFYRGPNAPTGGTGLGLSLVKGFVEAIGGNVKAANREDGGAEFTITLSLNHAIAGPPVSI